MGSNTSGPNTGFNFNIKKIRWYILEFWEVGKPIHQIELVLNFFESNLPRTLELSPTIPSTLDSYFQELGFVL